MIVFSMIKIDDQNTGRWKKPFEGSILSISDKVLETTKFGTRFIDRLINCIGEREIFPILKVITSKLLANSDWRYKYSAVTVLSQIGYYTKDYGQKL